MKNILTLLVLILFACTTDSPVNVPPDPVASDTVDFGFSLGLGCQGVCIDSLSVTEFYIGDIITATVLNGSIMFFDTAFTKHVYIADSLNQKYWNNLSYMTALVLRAQGSGTTIQRGKVTLPDNRIKIVNDSCMTWDQTAFPVAVPCIPILAVRP